MTDITTTTTPSDRKETIRLTIPAQATYAQIARLTATSVAARLAFTYDEIEDLRIAVGELCGVLVDDDADSRITLACTTIDDEITIEATRSPAGEPVHLSTLSEQILQAVTDDLRVDAASARITVQKRHQD